MEQIETVGLRFEGNGVKPSTVKASEVAELIKSFEAALLAVLKTQDGELNDDLIYVSFEEIKENCLLLKLRSHASNIITSAAIIAASFKSGYFDDYSPKTIEDLKTFVKFTKKYDCDGEILRNDAVIGTFNKETQVAYSDKENILGETTIYGEVKKAGGDNPRVTIRINDEYNISFDVYKDIAIQLATNLYREVGLIGRAKWNKLNYRILEFKPSEVVLLDEQPLLKTIDDLSSFFTKDALDNFDLIL